MESKFTSCHQISYNSFRLPCAHRICVYSAHSWCPTVVYTCPDQLKSGVSCQNGHKPLHSYDPGVCVPCAHFWPPPYTAGLPVCTRCPPAAGPLSSIPSASLVQIFPVISGQFLWLMNAYLYPESLLTKHVSLPHWSMIELESIMNIHEGLGKSHARGGVFWWLKRFVGSLTKIINLKVRFS